MSQDMERLASEPEVRMLTPGPLGAAGMRATNLLDLGALAGARGLKRAAVQSFMKEVETVGIQIALQSATKLLELTAQINQSQINQIVAEIKQIPTFTVPPQQTGLLGLLGRQPLTPIVEPPRFVSLDAVLAVLNAALRTTITE